jgi:hypothetical protein
MIPRTSALFVSCASGAFLGGSQGGGAGMPPLVTHSVQQWAVAWGRGGSGQRPEIFLAVFLGDFCYF